MPSVEAPSYTSARVQRASRINNVETARLQQRLQYIEKAKLHQCRLTNQDMRLISLSIDYIQSSSGHSPEAWRPDQQGPRGEDVEQGPQGPCFMYGERIISRKKRRMQRPMSAVERSSHGADSDSAAEGFLSLQRPKSSPSKQRLPSDTNWLRFPASSVDECDNDAPSSAKDSDAEKMTSHRSSSSDRRVVPHQDWEDDTSEITHKILKAQAQTGKRSVYATAGEVLTAQSSRTVRGLVRKIRITSSQPVGGDETDRSSSTRGHHGRPAEQDDWSPRRPPEMVPGLGRRAGLGEILNQRQPTLSAGEWRSHLGRGSASPISITAKQRLVQEARKRTNDARTEKLNQKIKAFIQNNPGSKHRSKSSFR